MVVGLPVGAAAGGLHLLPGCTILAILGPPQDQVIAGANGGTFAHAPGLVLPRRPGAELEMQLPQHVRIHRGAGRVHEPAGARGAWGAAGPAGKARGRVQLGTVALQEALHHLLTLHLGRIGRGSQLFVCVREVVDQPCPQHLRGPGLQLRAQQRGVALAGPRALHLTPGAGQHGALCAALQGQETPQRCQQRRLPATLVEPQVQLAQTRQLGQPVELGGGGLFCRPGGEEAGATQQVFAQIQVAQLRGGLRVQRICWQHTQIVAAEIHDLKCREAVCEGGPGDQHPQVLEG
eukprot:CAMPEP_0115070590 /NCGR_PEP_ID=MMETSP0227-20121206/13197_1 /TAXON_ID=89957 /ORGANISM="Polarella glacialis, Strain CCMP 1383" /LENGTH=291 /DNA_ID=CAMNT_0002457119 /DNA_START=393 /DNA_END=1268 /DNA_ORIENTATION=-